MDKSLGYTGMGIGRKCLHSTPRTKFPERRGKEILEHKTQSIIEKVMETRIKTPDTTRARKNKDRSYKRV